MDKVVSLFMTCVLQLYEPRKHLPSIFFLFSSNLQTADANSIPLLKDGAHFVSGKARFYFLAVVDLVLAVAP